MNTTRNNIIPAWWRGAQQAIGGLASIPGGPANIPLTGAPGGAGAATAVPATDPMAAAGTGPAEGAGPVEPDEMLELLRQIQQVKADDTATVESLKQQVTDILPRIASPDIKDRLQAILHALSVNIHRDTQTTDPQTGQKDPTPAELAEKLSEQVETMKSQDKNNQANSNTNPPAAPATPLANASVSFNWARHAQKHGGSGKPHQEKKHGNPFKVLMGACGKLLDHGMSKADIVRYLAKKMDYFQPEMIGKAVDIVRDYNKKGRREDHEQSDSPKADIQEEAFVTSPDPSMNGEFTGPDNFPGVVATSFNPVRHAAKKTPVQTPFCNGEDNSVSSHKPDYSKRSTAELMARLTWLGSLKSYNGDRTRWADTTDDKADMSGASSDVRAIRAALKARGFENSEIPGGDTNE